MDHKSSDYHNIKYTLQMPRLSFYAVSSDRLNMPLVTTNIRHRVADHFYSVYVRSALFTPHTEGASLLHHITPQNMVNAPLIWEDFLRVYIFIERDDKYRHNFYDIPG